MTIKQLIGKIVVLIIDYVLIKLGQPTRAQPDDSTTVILHGYSTYNSNDMKYNTITVHWPDGKKQYLFYN